MKNDYDVIVVGAGPAGSMAARHAAEGGASVLMLEKDRDIGTPVRCAEGVGEDGLQQFVEIRPEWISARITKVSMTAPDGSTVQPVIGKAVGYILDRKRFDFDLATMAAEAGAAVRTRHNVTGLIVEDGYVRGVKVVTPEGYREIRAKVVIGADGVESRVGRWAGLVTATKMKDMESAVQATVTNIDIDPECIQFYLSSFWAPGGYLWIFPKGQGKANIGLGVAGNYKGGKKAIDFLNNFLAEHFPEGSIQTLIAGGVPVAKTLKKFTANGLMLAGDAARMVDPVTGGGIISGMHAGKLAGIRAAESVQTGDHSEDFFKEYVKAWDKAGGKNHERLYNIKEAIYRFSDEDLNHIAGKVLEVTPEKRTIAKIFTVALWRKPSLLLDVAKLFATY